MKSLLSRKPVFHDDVTPSRREKETNCADPPRPCSRRPPASDPGPDSRRLCRPVGMRVRKAGAEVAAAGGRGSHAGEGGSPEQDFDGRRQPFQPPGNRGHLPGRRQGGEPQHPAGEGRLPGRGPRQPRRFGAAGPGPDRRRRALQRPPDLPIGTRRSRIPGGSPSSSF